ncbi:EAL domain-containing response regulator [Salinimonas chungwhensis]|uniref:EAL domain-containing response regulator n=1 Tax=Salinimonas chungwhensis TaxID=265425 RepID=UPI00036E9168|nr:EAL domain-containing protein [Salinimonas chungwhensis]
MTAKVLVLDDDEIIRLSLFHALTMEGFACSGCSNIHELLRASAALDPDVILIDLCLGKEDGLEAFSALAANNCKASIIVISGADIDVIDAALHAASARGLKVAGMLRKPFPLKALVQLITNSKTSSEQCFKSTAFDSQTVSASDLNNAILNRELSLVFQPKLDISTQSMVGAEVLCRWNSPRFGTIDPNVFIPMAEASGDIAALTDYVLISAIQWLSEFLSLRERFPPGLISEDFHLSVNISGESLSDGNFIDKLDTLVNDYRVTPSRLMLEMCESVAIGDNAPPPEVLTRLRLKGYRLAVNDLGTGLASIQQLVRLPFCELKIDRRFISTGLDNYESAKITSTLIKMGQGLLLKITAVGVEEADTLALLKQLGCHYAQGFYLAQPMADDALKQWLAQFADEKIPHRIATVRSMKPLPAQPEEQFDRLVRLAQRVFDKPIVAISILEQELCYLKARVGLEIQSIPAQQALCYRLLPDKDVLIIPDLQLDHGNEESPLQHFGKPVRFFASHALKASNGCIIGSVFVADISAENWLAENVEQLAQFARIIETEFTYLKDRQLDAVSQIPDKASFTRRADALVAFAAQNTLTVQVVKINLISSSLPWDKALSRLSKLARQVCSEADDLGRTQENQLCVLFIERSKDEVFKQLIKLEQQLKVLEETSAVIDSLRITHYCPSPGFGNSLQHVYCRPEDAQVSHIFIRS